MALDWNSASVWADFYGGINYSTYGKDFALHAERTGDATTDANRLANNRSTYFIRKARKLLKALLNHGATSTDRINNYGCGYNYLVWAFRRASSLASSFDDNEAGIDDFANTWGIDNSTLIAAGLLTNQLAVETIVEADWTKNNTVAVQTALTTLTGGTTFDWVLTNEVVHGLTNQELNAVANACERGLAGANLARIVHIVHDIAFDSTILSAYPVLASQPVTVQDWAALKPTHSWVGSVSKTLIVGA